MKNLKQHISSYCFLVFIGVLAVLLFVLPKKDFSEKEKRYLEDMPVFSVANLTSGKLAEQITDYTSDHFPFRDFFVGLYSHFELAEGGNGNSGVYLLSDDSLAAVPGDYNENSLKRNLGYLEEFAVKNSLDTRLIIVPTQGAYKEKELPEVHRPYHDEEIFSLVEREYSDLHLIDLRDVFPENDPGIYYGTDHHLTSYASYLMYKAYCESVQLVPLEEFEIETESGFYGTNYSKSGLWETEADEVEVWHAKTDNDFHVEIDDTTEQKESDSLFFYDHFEEMDKYPVFLDGNHALVSIRNEDCHNGRKLLILKDSYAHCFTCFLCENYEEVYMIDLRYWRYSVSDLVKEKGIGELLILYGAENLASSSDISWLE